MSVLLIQDGNVETSDQVSIEALLESKIQDVSIMKVSTLELKTKIIDPDVFNFCITNDHFTAQYLKPKVEIVFYWDNLSDISSKIDMFLQLSRCIQLYPLNLKDWKLVEVLHNSKDSIIYRAVNRDGLVAAIKRFKFNPNQLSRESIRHFLERVEKQCGLRSKRLVHFYDGGICDHAFYLVMEYLKYGTLRQTINGCDKTLPLVHALQWFQEIVLALDSVHQAGLVHRDLKIDNVMMRGDGTLALTDYGVSKRILLDAGFLNEDELHCSPHYVSPEQINGKPCTQTSDIYSLGVIFYELLTGGKPYACKEAFELMMHHVMAPVPRLPENLSQYQAILDRMMAKNPADRYCCAISAIEGLAEAA